MKNLSYIIVMGFTFCLISCGGKGSNPTPNNTNTGSGTGIGTITDNTPDYQISLADGNQTILNDTHDKITAVNFILADKNAMKFSTLGTVNMRVKNFVQTDVTYDNDSGGFNENLYLSNAVQLSEKSTIAIKDTSTKACWIVTDPSAKDASGKQIIQVIYLFNNTIQGAGSIGFQSKTKFIANEITADQAVVLFTLNNLKSL